MDREILSLADVLSFNRDSQSSRERLNGLYLVGRKG